LTALKTLAFYGPVFRFKSVIFLKY